MMAVVAKVAAVLLAVDRAAVTAVAMAVAARAERMAAAGVRAADMPSCCTQGACRTYIPLPGSSDHRA